MHNMQSYVCHLDTYESENIDMSNVYFSMKNPRYQISDFQNTWKIVIVRSGAQYSAQY